MCEDVGGGVPGNQDAAVPQNQPLSPIERGLASCRPRSGSGLPLVYENKVLLQHGHTYSRGSVEYSYRDRMAYEA